MATSKNSPGFHHIALKAFDFDKTIEFYQKALGYRLDYTWRDAPVRGAMLDTGDGNYIEVFEGRAATDVPSEGGVLHFAVRTPSTDDAYILAMANGAVSVDAPKDVVIPGNPPVKIRIAFIKGLDGEVIEFFQNDDL